MIGGIGNWLKKRVDDVQGAFGVSNTAQTFKTNTPKAAPARTISRQPQPQQFSQPAQTNKITNDVNSVMQPRFNLNQSLQNNGVNTQSKIPQVAPGSGVLKPSVYDQENRQAIAQKMQEPKAAQPPQRNFAQKAWDQVNVLDSGRSWGTAKPSQQQAKRNVISQAGDIPGNMFRSTVGIGNMAAEGVAGGVEVARAVTARATGNKGAERAAIDRASRNTFTDKGQGLFGVGSGGVGGDNPNFKDMTARDVAKNVVSAGVGGAAELLPMSKGANLGYRAAGGSIVKQLPRIAGEDAALGLAGSASQQVLQNGRIDPKQLIKDTGMSVLLGQASVGGGAAYRKAKSLTPPRVLADGTPNISRIHKDQLGYTKDAIVGGLTGDARKRISQRAFGDLQARRGQVLTTADGMGIDLSRAGNRKYTSTGASLPNSEFILKQRLAPRIDDVLKNSREIDTALNVKRNVAGDMFSYNQATQAPKAVEANQPMVPRGNLQEVLQPDTAYSDMLRGIEAQTQQPQVFDPELKKLERQKQQIIDAEARAKYEASKQLAQDQKDLRKTIRASGGIGSSDYETLPSGLKRKNGRALDDLATELGFESDQALVDELTTHTQPERLKDLREVVEHEMKNGKSELSGDYKNLLKAIDDRHAELLRYPEGAKVVKNTQEFPSLDEFNSLLSTPEAQSNSNKTKQAVSAATADLRKQQFDAVVKGDLDTADQVRKKIGEIETGLKRTAPEVKREVETVQPVIKSIKDKAVREKFVAATKGYLGTKNSNKIERQVAIRDLENKYKLSEAEKLNAIQALDSSTVKPANDNVANYVKEFRSLTDSAYKQYRESGVNMGYQSSYLPRIYQNPETGQMYDSAEFELLQRGSKRMKGREADKVNTDWLVERDPTKLLERYYDSMDKVAAGQKYMKELQNAGLITASTEPVPGLRPIVAEGMQNESGMTYYAPKQVADKLNTMFGSKETTNLVEKVMEKGSGINSLFQGFVLSGGIPNTPVNSFGMMQVMKEAMTLHPVKAGRAIHAGFSKKFADKYFTSRKDMIKLMAENDVDIRIDLSETGKSGWQRTKEAWSDSKAKGLNRGWDEITNDSTFKRFMPMLEVVHFENMYKKAYKKTGDQAKAARIAAESVKNFYGKTGEYKQAVRSKLSNDSMGAVLFAPRFRESMVNFWGKNIKALNPKNMTKLEYRDNIKFLVASGITFAAMNSLNEALNGVNMWDNPDDKKDKLIIPSEKLKQLGINTNGKDVGVPFLSSIATVPRNAISGAASFVTGDLESAGKRAKSFLSMPLSSAGDLIANEDYFGNRIVKDDVKGLDRFTQMAAYTAGRNMQPWMREGLNKFGTKLPDDLKKRLGVKEKGGFETAANALESPLRFYNPEYYKYGGKWAPRGDGVKFDSIAEQKAASQSQTNNTTGKSSRVKIADNLGSEYKKILTRYNDMSSEDREKLFFSENAAEYQYSLARYENDLAKGTLSVADKVVRKKSVAKAEVGSKFSKDTRESYDKLTKAELQNLTNNDPDGKRIWEDAVAYGDALVAAGIIKKNKLKTGSASGGSKKKGGSSRKGLVSNYKSSDTSAISKKLQQLAFGSSKSKSGSSAPKKHAAKLKGVRSA